MVRGISDVGSADPETTSDARDHRSASRGYGGAAWETGRVSLQIIVLFRAGSPSRVRKTGTPAEHVGTQDQRPCGWGRVGSADGAEGPDRRHVPGDTIAASSSRRVWSLHAQRR
jgi:hypothetical protein